MEFPQRIATNVQSTLVPFIHWQLYQTEHSDLDNTYERMNDLTSNASSSKETWDNRTKLLDAVRTFRLHNRYAFLDGPRLWIFPRSGKELTASLPEYLSSLIEDVGLKLYSAGTYTSRQLGDRTEDPFNRLRRSGNATYQTPLPQAVPSFSSLDADSHASTIYRAFISSILSFMADRFVARGGWSILGVDSCVRVLENRRFASTSYETGRWERRHKVEQLCFDVQWSLSGTMILYSRLISLPMLSRVSDVMGRKDASGADLVRMDDPIVISPFGTRCAFAGVESHQSQSFTAAGQAMAWTRALLKSCAVDVSPEVEWICLTSNEGILDDSNLVNKLQRSRLWWPAHLCFVLHSSYRPEWEEPLRRLAEGTFNDPLAEAEQWFLGRDARKAAIEAREEGDKKGQLHAHQPSESGLQPNEDEKTAFARTEQFLSAQEASGIYPTPPDGLTFHTQDSADVPLVEAQTSPANEDLVMEASSGDSPATHFAARPAGKDDDQDLFGDLDTDMFNNNVLTEDDFNFFDEPNAKEDYHTVAKDSLALLRGGSLPPAEADVPADAESPNLSNPEDVQMECDEPVDQNEEITTQISVFPNDEPKDQVYLTTPTSVSSGPKGNEVDEADPTRSLDVRHSVQETSDPKKRSSFDSIRLQTRRSHNDEKYRSDGRYAVSFTGAVDGPRPGEPRQITSLELPKTGLLRVLGDDSSEETNDSAQDDYSFSDWDNDERYNSFPAASESKAGHGSDSYPSKKRKRQLSPQEFDLATPAASLEAPQSITNTPDDIEWDLENGFPRYRSARDLFKFCADYQTYADTTLVGDNLDFIQIAQLVGDQKVLQHNFTDLSSDFVHNSDDVYSLFTPDDLPGAMKEIFSAAFPNTQECDLRSFVELGVDPEAGDLSKEIPQESIDRERQSPLPGRGMKSHDDLIVKTQSPYLRAKRGEDAIDILPPALYFWEELGLAPVQQNKDVMAFCIYPDNDAIREAASDFLATMESAYQSCRFGRHRCASGLRKYQDGLVPVPIVSAKPDAVVESLHRVCEDFGAEIPPMEAGGADYVIYMVNPFNDEAMLPQLCAAFNRLFSVYASRAKKPSAGPERDLVLQVIPLNFLANWDRLTIPPPKAYVKLAFELYSRCSPVQREDEITASPFTSGSAVRLAKTIPRTIDFRLTSQPPDGLLGGNSSIHLAYSWSADQEWLACAWTDHLGAQQWTAVYCLQQSEPDRWAAFSDTVKEILDTTKDMTHPPSQSWKIYLVKDCEIQQREQISMMTVSYIIVSPPTNMIVPVWRLHSASAFTTNMTMSILSIDTNPPLAIPPKKPSIPFPLPASDMDTSPAATTPYDQAPTPDYSSPTSTQTPTHHAPLTSGFTDPDPSARLIDIVSETWCLLSPFPIPNPSLLTAHLFAPVAMSGYLLKRAGSDDEDGLMALGVNLISTDVKMDDAGVKTEQEEILKEDGRLEDGSSALAFGGGEEGGGGS
ncbi:MAG: hypothetical protein LQ341_003766 [Variospora aurantia]|nr:MAG: hypothetical protein LQ341_003766 [Variospora aurantia]